MLFFKKKQKSEIDNHTQRIILGSNDSNLNSHRDAAQEHIKALTGYDGDTQQYTQKSLHKIAGEKPNLNAQKGFSAEIKEVAYKNEKEILKGSNIRYSRVDDLPNHSINETPYDIMATQNGQEITETGSQLKFRQDLSKKLTSNEYQKKYPHGNFTIPKDQFDNVSNNLDNEIRNLEIQLNNATKQNNLIKAKELQQKLDYCKRVKNNLKSSELTMKEAEFSVKHPYQTTVNDVFKVGTDAGIEYAKSAASIQFCMSFAKIIPKLVNNEITVEDALKEMSAETAKSASLGFVTGEANTILASMFKNSSSEFLKTLGTSNAPAQLIVLSTNIIKIVNDRMSNKITDEECFNNIAKAGINVATSAKSFAIGFSVGGIVGGIITSTISTMIIGSAYDYTINMLNAPNIAHQERLQIERECNKLHAELEEYRTIFKNTYVAHTNELQSIFGNSIQTMALALNINDIDSFIMGANTITRALGETPQFNNINEFEDFLNSNDKFEL